MTALETPATVPATDWFEVATLALNVLQTCFLAWLASWAITTMSASKRPKSSGRIS